MFKKALLISSIFHLLLIIRVGFSLPHPKSKLPHPQDYLELVTWVDATPQAVKSNTSVTSTSSDLAKHNSTKKEAVPSKTLRVKIKVTKSLPDTTKNATPFQVKKNTSATTAVADANSSETPSKLISEIPNSPEARAQNSVTPPIASPEFIAAQKIKHLQPVYPKLARKKNWSGVVILNLSISTTGAVMEVKIIKSSGYQILDQAAIAAVQAWRYQPATTAGLAVVSEKSVKLQFKLEDD